VCLPDPQGVDLRRKIPVTHPDLLLDSRVSRRTGVILIDGPLGMLTTTSGIAIAVVASHEPANVTRRQGRNAGDTSEDDSARKDTTDPAVSW
jgi:hypothetical protein